MSFHLKRANDMQPLPNRGNNLSQCMNISRRRAEKEVTIN